MIPDKMTNTRFDNALGSLLKNLHHLCVLVHKKNFGNNLFSLELKCKKKKTTHKQTYTIISR